MNLSKLSDAKSDDTKPTQPDLSRAARFGRSELPLLWVERGGLVELAVVLKNDRELQLDWVEHLTVMKMDDLLVISYFLRSFSGPGRLVLRTTVSAVEGASLPSVRRVWPTALAGEHEASERFGIRFEAPK